MPKIELNIAIRHSDVVPEHSCGGKLIPMEKSTPYVCFAQCAFCGAEFAFEPDSEWVTIVLPSMKP
jgi:hypothetical protein